MRGILLFCLFFKQPLTFLITNLMNTMDHVDRKGQQRKKTVQVQD